MTLPNLLSDLPERKKKDLQNPRLIIARKWNSWYPSYFDVRGGSYLFVFRNGVVAIDPGFQFTGIIRQFGINPLDINTIFLTHLHSDHFAGLIEFLTLRHKIGSGNLTLYANDASFQFFKSIIQENTHLRQIVPGLRVEIQSLTEDLAPLCNVEVLPAHHREQDGQCSSIGLVFEVPASSGKIYRVGLMGDTDGSEGYIEEYYRNYNNVELLIPHIGTVEDGKRPSGDKHLYLDGLQRIVGKFEKPELFLLGEFGLEMGALSEIVEGVTSYVTATPRKILQKTIRKILKEESFADCALFIAATNSLLKNRRRIEFIIDLAQFISSDDGKWWKSPKSSWGRNSRGRYVQPDDRVLNALLTGDRTNIRRSWSYLTHYETELKDIIERIQIFAKNMTKTGWTKEFLDLTKEIRWNKSLQSHLITIVLHRPISPKLRDILKSKSIERIKGFLDQIAMSWIILRLGIVHFSNGQQDSIPFEDYRCLIANYFDLNLRKETKRKQRVVPGEYGTVITFKDNLCLNTICSGCQTVEKELPINHYEKSEYDKKRRYIKHLRDNKCPICQEAESAYLEQYEQYDEEYIEEIQAEQFEEEERLWKAGAFAYFFEIGPPSLKKCLIEPAEDLKLRLFSHLVLTDDITDDNELALLPYERQVIKSLTCSECKQQIFQIDANENLRFKCSKCDSEKELPRSLAEISHSNGQIQCIVCDSENFEVALGFEYLRVDKVDPTEENYSKLHIATSCIRCGNNTPICCPIDEKKLGIWLESTLERSSRFIRTWYPYTTISKNETIVNILFGLGDHKLLKTIVKMATSDDYLKKNFIFSVLDEKLLGANTIKLAKKLLFSDDNWIQAFVCEFIEKKESKSYQQIPILWLVNINDDPWLKYLLKTKKEFFLWPSTPRKR